MKKYQGEEENYAELKLLGRRYRHYMELRISALQELIHILDYTMPGINSLLKSSRSDALEKNILGDFAEEFWHFDRIKAMGKEKFVSTYAEWAK